MLFSVAEFAVGQNIPEEKILHYEEAVISLDTVSCTLHSVFITNDTLALAFRKAMTHYPELCYRKIQLQYGRIKTSMAAQPRFWSVFRNSDKRTYKVIINNNPRKPQTQLIYAAPFDARVGVMGHELAHILDYSTKSGWQIALTGVKYIGKKSRRKIEWQTDMVAIERGLGWQVYHFAYFVTHKSDIDNAYRQYKSDIYMKPEEIFEIITFKNEEY